MIRPQRPHHFSAALGRLLLWGGIGVLGAVAVATIALSRGETINSLWFIIAAVCVGSLAYRFYGAFIAAKILALDPKREMPSRRLEDGRDFIPTNRWVVFGHHFAAIAGPGPLIGPTLAAQFGYLPGTLWILVGAALGGCVQDIIILCFSARRNARSLGQIARDELGPLAGNSAMIGLMVIMVILIAVLGLVVVNAMKHSPWAVATVGATIPIAVLVGFYMRNIRPGKIVEGTLIGVGLLILAVIGGGSIAHSDIAGWFDFNASELAWMLIAYGFAASTLPVWLLLAPRDYLSTFMKLGTVVLLAAAILALRPDIQMPALTRFIDGSGPIFAGSVFPFVFITIACGAISGFHSLVCSGTTPKLLESERDIRFIGFGAMAIEMFVAIMAIVAATILQPGVYFAINAPAGIAGATVADAVASINAWGFHLEAGQMQALAASVGEKTLFARTGGAPSLAVGMATVFASLTSDAMIAIWYHFAIMFEALFILTTLDAGTRVGRFMLQDMLAQFMPGFSPLSQRDGFHTSKRRGTINGIVASAIFCAAWGYFLYAGTIDPLGGINSLWPLFGISNQMLGVIALAVACVIIVKSGKHRYVWVTALPMVWMLIVTSSAAAEKLFSDDIRIGFLAHAGHLRQGLEAGTLARDIAAKAPHLIVNDHINAGLCVFFTLITWIMVSETVRICYNILTGRAYPPSSEVAPSQFGKHPSTGPAAA